MPSLVRRLELQAGQASARLAFGPFGAEGRLVLWAEGGALHVHLNSVHAVGVPISPDFVRARVPILRKLEAEPFRLEGVAFGRAEVRAGVVVLEMEGGD